MASGSSWPLSTFTSSTLGKKISVSASARVIAARASSSDHSFKRRLESNETSVPALCASAIASNTVSRALAEIASEIPDTCRILDSRISSRGNHCGVIRLAAEPARK